MIEKDLELLNNLRKDQTIMICYEMQKNKYIENKKRCIRKVVKSEREDWHKKYKKQDITKADVKRYKGKAEENKELTKKNVEKDNFKSDDKPVFGGLYLISFC